MEKAAVIECCNEFSSLNQDGQDVKDVQDKNPYPEYHDKILTILIQIYLLLGITSNIFREPKKHTSNSEKKLICPRMTGTSLLYVHAKARETGGNGETSPVINTPQCDVKYLFPPVSVHQQEIEEDRIFRAGARL